jgi:IS605 OrfB family transposase
MMKNIPDMNSFFIQSAAVEAKGLFKRNEKHKNIIFGGKYNFKQRCQNKISNKQFNTKRLLPFSILGDNLKQGNRNFILDIIENNQIIFKLNRTYHYDLELPNLRQNIKNQLFKLQELNEVKQKEHGYTYSIKLTETHIYISFEEFKNDSAEYIENRYIGIDLNPTNIGISICECQDNGKVSILATKQYDFSKIVNQIFDCKKSSNDKQTVYLNNKLDFETLQISKSISELSKYWKCKYIFCEDLNFKSKTKQSKGFNRLTKNIWKRNKFLQNLQKRCRINNQIFKEVNPAYTSVIGNLKYDFVDAVNASIEIGRRGYEFGIKRNKDSFYPAVKLKQSIQHQWKEMGIDIQGGSWKEISLKLKNLKFKYRVSLNECLHLFEVFSFGNKSSKVILYDFN